VRGDSIADECASNSSAKHREGNSEEFHRLQNIGPVSWFSPTYSVTHCRIVCLRAFGAELVRVNGANNISVITATVYIVINVYFAFYVVRSGNCLLSRLAGSRSNPSRPRECELRKHKFRMTLEAEEMRRASFWRRLWSALLNLFCCGLGTEHERDHIPLDGTSYSQSHDVCSRPLQDVSDDVCLLQPRRPGEGSSSMCRLSPQEKQFKSMRRPSFTAIPRQGVSFDEETCLICLEEFSETNPKVHLSCAHGFHLSCLLEWQERGKTECPVCDITFGSLDET
jgi:hypothetical protein